MAPRGPKPKPTHLKLVTGNPGKRPLNKKEALIPRSAVMPDPPAHLDLEARREWKRIGADLWESGILTKIDRAVLAAYCSSYSTWVRGERALAKMAKNDPLTDGLVVMTKSRNAIQNPLIGIVNKAKADMVRYAAELGMTPSARSRIEANPPQGAEDPARKYID